MSEDNSLEAAIWRVSVSKLEATNFDSAVVAFTVNDVGLVAMMYHGAEGALAKFIADHEYVGRRWDGIAVLMAAQDDHGEILWVADVVVFQESDHWPFLKARIVYRRTGEVLGLTDVPAETEGFPSWWH